MKNVESPQTPGMTQERESQEMQSSENIRGEVREYFAQEKPGTPRGSALIIFQAKSYLNAELAVAKKNRLSKESLVAKTREVETIQALLNGLETQ